MNIWDDVKNYKKCKKKNYTIYVCMPPKNTVVFNKLEQADAVKMLNGKTFFEADEIIQLKNSNSPLFGLIQQLISAGKGYVVNDQTPFVLCGTVGEFWAISPDKLAQKYRWANSDFWKIDQWSLEKKMKDGILDWTQVQTYCDGSPDPYACFVPSNMKGQIATPWGAVLNINGVDVSHGKGDFVIAQPLPTGQPNMQDRYVVNGEVFATTYNNQGWTDCISSKALNHNITIDKLPKFKGSKSLGDLVKLLYEERTKVFDNGVYDKTCLDDLKHDEEKQMLMNNKNHFYVEVGMYDYVVVFSDGHAISVEKRNAANPVGNSSSPYLLNNNIAENFINKAKTYLSFYEKKGKLIEKLLPYRANGYTVANFVEDLQTTFCDSGRTGERIKNVDYYESGVPNNWSLQKRKEALERLPKSTNCFFVPINNLCYYIIYVTGTYVFAEVPNKDSNGGFVGEQKQLDEEMVNKIAEQAEHYNRFKNSNEDIFGTWVYWCTLDSEEREGLSHDSMSPYFMC